MSRLNLCYHLTKVTRLARRLRFGRNSQVGRAALRSHGHDQALAKVLYRGEITRTVMQRDSGGEPAEHFLLAVLRQHAECPHEGIGKFLVIFQ
jgi:hypothetical protein